MRPSLLFMAVLLSAGANAATTVVSLEREGVVVGEGEICRFAAADEENPFRRWLSSQDVTCVVAGSEMSFPRGRWNVFGRVVGSAVSIAPLLIDGDSAPATLSLSLSPAASLVPVTSAGQSAVVHATRSGSAFPLEPGGDRVTVPAGEPLWLFVLEKSQPVAFLPVAPLEPGSERTVSAAAAGATGTVVTWLQIPESDRAALRRARGAGAPAIHVTFSGSAHEAEPLPPLDLLNSSFVAVRGLPPGEATLEIGGRGWLPLRRRLGVEAAPVTVVKEPLVARGAASVIVHWSTTQDLPELDASIGSCTRAETAPELEIALLQCPAGLRPLPAAGRAGCGEIREQTFPPGEKSGSFAVDDVPPGVYLAEIRFGKLPAVAAPTSVGAFDLKEVRVRPWYEVIEGSLTRGGAPLGRDAAIRFADGVGFASKESSDYRAVTVRSRLDTDDLIDITSCDGGVNVTVVADRPPGRGSRFNIDIPENELTISVSDTFTRLPLFDATVRYVVMSKLRTTMPRPLITHTISMRQSGPGRPGAASIRIEAVPERQVHLTVYAPGYEKQNVRPFTMSKSEKKTIDVQLVPLRGTQAKIVSQQMFENATVMWFTPSGDETERADVDPDGTFVAARNHQPDETMVVVSPSHPLWVTQSPEIGRRSEVAIPFPDGRSRDFEVSLRGAEGDEERLIGLIVGGVRVPQAALRQHGRMRRIQTLLRGGGPLLLRDLAESGPIDVILGPRIDELPARWESIDILASSQFAAAPRKRLAPGATAIEFELE